MHMFPTLRNRNLFIKLCQLISIINYGARLVRRENIAVTCGYDPLKLGIIATCIKLLGGCRSVVEINGHIKDARAAQIADPTSSNWLKKHAFNIIGRLTIYYADGVKLLNEEQFNEWQAVAGEKPCFIFPDFVPVSLFQPGLREGQYILCMGFPFRVKGVDILMQSFSQVTGEFPEITLKIMGYCPENELREWREKADGIPGIYFCKPVANSEVEKIINNCVFLVLPSRTEGMGRVLVEAMACGKALLGSRVGGIPEVIKEGENGLLFESENIEQLTGAMRKLLADGLLRKTMEQNSLRRVRTVFSEERYVDSYHAMLTGISNGGYAKQKGIVFKKY